MIKSLGIRRWIAWKLVQLAARVYYSELHQTLSVYAPDGHRIVQWLVVGDDYCAGTFPQDMHYSPDGYTVIWEDKWPDYMYEDVS